MDRSELSSKWDNITSSNINKGYQALRVSSSCFPDLFLATDEDGNRCLLLYLKNDSDIKLRSTVKAKLQIIIIPSKKILLIKLKDYDFADLFDDLILSIFSKIYKIKDHEEASEEFIKAFYKWSQFFEDSNTKKLSEEQIQGLFGELFILNEYIENSTSSSINKILDSWKGLYDSTNDFEFDQKNIEVKTKKNSISFVKVSSEYQLEKKSDKQLELLVLSIILDLSKGKSIHDIFLEIMEKARSQNGDLSILYKALNQKGLTVDYLKEYNNHRFKVAKKESFDAGNSNFPKLCRSNISEEISNLKYKLRITHLNDFLIELKKY